MAFVRQPFRGRAIVRIGEYGSGTNVRVGVVSNMVQTIEVDDDSIPNMESQGGGTVWEDSNPKSVSVEMDFEELHDITVQAAMRAGLTAVTAAAVSNEEITLMPGSLSQTAFMLDTALTVTLTATAWANETAYVAGDCVLNDTGKIYTCITAGTSAASPATGPSGTTSDITDGTAHWKYVKTGLTVDVDYALSASGIEALDGGVLTDTDGYNLIVSYTKQAYSSFEIMTESLTDYYVLIDGTNDASGLPFTGKMHKGRFKPVGLNLVTEKHGVTKMQFTCNKDDSITTVGLSQYMTMRRKKAA